MHFYIYKNTLLWNVYITLHNRVVSALPEMNVRFPTPPTEMWLSTIAETPLVVEDTHLPCLSNYWLH